MASCTANGTTSAYTYGADGLRRSMTVNGVTTYYAYDGQTMTRELNGALVKTATYLAGPRGPEYRRDDTQTEPDGQGHTYGKTRWYVYDGLGSVVGEVDPAGNVTASDRYDVYGAVRGRTGTASTAHGFVGSLGHLSDAATGLVYMRARYYDPSTGRFASQDPDLQGFNWFVYCGQNPVNNADFDGKSFKQVSQVAFAMWTVLAGCGITEADYAATIRTCLAVAKACFDRATVLFLDSEALYLMPDAMDQEEQLQLQNAQMAVGVGLAAAATIGGIVALHTLALVGLLTTIDGAYDATGLPQ